MPLTPFLADIMICSFNFAPKGWANANGQFLPINQNQALFSLLGTTFGGNGQTTFQLPDLRGRVAQHTGGGFTLGQAIGSASVTLNIQQLPTHLHVMQAFNGDATQGASVTPPAGNSFATANAVPFGGGTTAVNRFSPPNNANGTLAPGAISNVGGSQPHENRQPYLVTNQCIALIGAFPSRN
jgi:microcystin-dependent protein